MSASCLRERIQVCALYITARFAAFHALKSVVHETALISLKSRNTGFNAFQCISGKISWVWLLVTDAVFVMIIRIVGRNVSRG